MRTSLALWLLGLIYLLTTVGPRTVESPLFTVTDSEKSYLSTDSNQVDQGQISLRTTNSTAVNRFEHPEFSHLIEVTDFPTYLPKINFLFLDLPPYIYFPQKTFRPPIALRS